MTTIRLWINQQTMPPQIEIDGIAYTVEAFSLQFSYHAQQPYRGILHLEMDHIPIARDAPLLVIFDGWQWSGKRLSGISRRMVSGDYRYPDEMGIELMGPPTAISTEVICR